MTVTAEARHIVDAPLRFGANHIDANSQNLNARLSKFRLWYGRHCRNCYNGQHQPNARSVVCYNCAAGSYAPNNNAPHEHCTACERGRYHTSIAHTGPCITCSAGRYAETHGTVTCNDCENGGERTSNKPLTVHGSVRMQSHLFRVR